MEPLGGPITALIEKRSTLAVIIGGTFRDPRVTLEALSSVEIVAVVASGHPLAIRFRAKPANESDLADHLQIVLSDPTTLSEGRDFRVLSPHTCRVNNQDTKHELIRSGLGWGSLPLWQSPGTSTKNGWSAWTPRLSAATPRSRPKPISLIASMPLPARPDGPSVKRWRE